MSWSHGLAGEGKEKDTGSTPPQALLSQGCWSGCRPRIGTCLEACAWSEPHTSARALSVQLVWDDEQELGSLKPCRRKTVLQFIQGENGAPMPLAQADCE
eukprot:scaffold112100_cov23-Tisochrysis_lutea.AAC.2